MKPNRADEWSRIRQLGNDPAMTEPREVDVQVEMERLRDAPMIINPRPADFLNKTQPLGNGPMVTDPHPADGWPEHWYDENEHLSCLAPGCTMKFDDNTADLRTQHWDDDNDESDLWCNHRILLAMSRQVDCPYCNYHNATRNLKLLFRHERVMHGSSSMSSIEGWLNLLRAGHAMPGIDLCAAAIFRRLVRNVYRSRYRELLLARAGFEYGLRPDAPVHYILAKIVSYTNVSRGMRAYVPITRMDFLSHLPPREGERQEYRDALWELRRLYTKGIL